MKFVSMIPMLAATAYALKDSAGVVMVAINVQCDNANIYELDEMARDLTAKAIAGSYNKLRELVDHGDSYLANVRLGKDAFLGDWGCCVCRGDDNSFLMTGGAMRAWETALTSSLASSAHNDLSRAGACKISLYTFPGMDAPKRDAGSSKVAIGVSCKGLAMDTLSIKAAGFATSALEKAYNGVQNQGSNNGDRFLVNVHAENISKAGKYLGDWVCYSCDDDDSFLMSSGISTRAWEAAFVSALLSSPFDEFVGVDTCSITMTVDESIQLKDFGKEKDSNKVSIGLSCDGLDMDTVDLKATDFITRALEDAYNQVHEVLGDGDGFLAKVYYDNNEFLGKWGCYLCRNDDDDSFMMSSGSVTRAWGAAVVSALQRSEHQALSNVQSCTISLKNKVDTDEQKKPENEGSTNVLIAVSCDNVSMEELSPKAVDLSIKALEDSYNRVHKMMDNEGSSLNNVIFNNAGTTKETGALRGIKGSFAEYLGKWGCTFCPNDDDSFVMTGKAALRAWEVAFGAILAESPFPEFANSKACNIAMMMMLNVLAE